MIQLLSSLFKSEWSHREGSPDGLKLILKLLELRGRWRKAFNLTALKITKFFVKPRGVLKVLVVREVEESDRPT